MIVVDGGRCRLIGLCEASAPEVFELGDTSVQLLDPSAEGVRVEAAVEACPTRALSISPQS